MRATTFSRPQSACAAPTRAALRLPRCPLPTIALTARLSSTALPSRRQPQRRSLLLTRAQLLGEQTGAASPTPQPVPAPTPTPAPPPKRDGHAATASPSSHATPSSTAAAAAAASLRQLFARIDATGHRLAALLHVIDEKAAARAPYAAERLAAAARAASAAAPAEATTGDSGSSSGGGEGGGSSVAGGGSVEMAASGDLWEAVAMDTAAGLMAELAGACAEAEKRCEAAAAAAAGTAAGTAGSQAPASASRAAALRARARGLHRLRVAAEAARTEPRSGPARLALQRQLRIGAFADPSPQAAAAEAAPSAPVPTPSQVAASGAAAAASGAAASSSAIRLEAGAASILADVASAHTEEMQQPAAAAATEVSAGGVPGSVHMYSGDSSGEDSSSSRGTQTGCSSGDWGEGGSGLGAWCLLGLASYFMPPVIGGVVRWWAYGGAAVQLAASAVSRERCRRDG
ncbi:hypothetical protein HYH03_017670 [Edaphochlamys debaryana]|uniref:Uncharacterized protein n=1 Tax=Edaphochlamys debaryana TaxID=47281 RepID=A0A835XIM9_9CHLO|nr:hypothetical protein HYH03_017670 [Edaphochlamys debaryana]|eukprot:KAG2483488.1 hypothetical protein HYH03_017670 [Edaphochlamys debaryana]